MNFEFSDEQLMLREQARGFLAQHCPPAVTRNVLESDADYDAELWQNVADMGWMATTIPEQYGGLGLTYYELAIIAEELGRVVAPLPFSSSVYLATEAILQFGSEQQKARWLPLLASGEMIATVAMTERPGQLSEHSISTRFHEDTLTGQKQPVADSAISTLIIVLAKNADDELVLCACDATHPTVVHSSLRSLDFSRGHSAVQFNSSPAEVLTGKTTDWASIQELLDRAAVLVAWEQLGIADVALEQACEYAKQRYAFGRPIGSFQAIKHKLAGMYVKNTLARSNAYFGAWALAIGSDQLPLAAATARVAAIQASVYAAQENIQTHGGMGFTWEFDCQFYYRRAKLLSLAIGSERYWQDRLVTGFNNQTPNAA